MVYWRHYKGVNKFRCPDVFIKVGCIHGSAWCIYNSNFGHVTKSKPKDNPRYILSTYRGSKNWHKIYDKITSVERTLPG